MLLGNSCHSLARLPRATALVSGIPLGLSDQSNNSGTKLRKQRFEGRLGERPGPHHHQTHAALQLVMMHYVVTDLGHSASLPSHSENLGQESKKAGRRASEDTLRSRAS